MGCWCRLATTAVPAYCWRWCPKRWLRSRCLLSPPVTPAAMAAQSPQHAMPALAVKQLPFVQLFAASATAASVGEVRSAGPGRACTGPAQPPRASPQALQRSTELPGCHGAPALIALCSGRDDRHRLPPPPPPLAAVPARLHSPAALMPCVPPAPQVLTIPFDTCKVRLQLQGRSSGPVKYQ